MEISVVGIVVWKNQVYLPVQGKTDSGIFVNTEPIFVCDLSIEEITRNLQKVLEAGHPRIQVRTPEERKKYSDLMLKATGTKSWKELARRGISYTIEWSDKGILIEMSRLDDKGRWEYDPEKTKRFPPNTSLREVVMIILEDVRLRS